MPEFIKNDVLHFFEQLAINEGIDLDHKWKATLVDKIGSQIGVKKSDLIMTWINRGGVPSHAAKKLLSLDIPDELKKLCKQWMQTKKVGFSIEDHIDAGKKLKRIHRELCELQSKVSAAYALTISNKLTPIIESLTKFKSELDRKLFEEHEGLPRDAMSEIYYGGYQEKDKAVAEIASKYGYAHEDLIAKTVELLNADNNYKIAMKTSIDSFHRSLKDRRKNLENIYIPPTGDRRKY